MLSPRHAECVRITKEHAQKRIEIGKRGVERWKVMFQDHLNEGSYTDHQREMLTILADALCDDCERFLQDLKEEHRRRDIVDRLEIEKLGDPGSISPN